jgi:hypothetical protein
MKIEDLLTELHFSQCKTPAAIAGNDTYMDLINEAKAAMHFPTPIDTSDHLKVGGFTVWSNELPGTRGFWIGEEEEMKVVRRYIKSGYFHENTIEVIGPGASTTRFWKP